MRGNDIGILLRRMSEGYQKQMPLYEEMYNLALEQEKCVQAVDVDTEQLFALINRRQELINDLELRQVKIGKYKDEVVSSLGISEFTISGISRHCSDMDVAALAETLEKFTALLIKVKDLDKTNEETLRTRIKETADNLSNVQKEKKARNAYQQKAANKDGVFVDFSK